MGDRDELPQSGTSQVIEQNERIAITQTIGVSGLGGIGKTQLALEYAHRCYLGIYHSVFFVNAADKASLDAGYLSLAHLLHYQRKMKEKLNFTWAWATTANGAWRDVAAFSINRESILAC